MGFIDIHIHADIAELLRGQHRITRMQEETIERLKDMATSLELMKGYVQQIDAETTRIALLFEAQVQLLKDGTISADDLATNVQPAIDKLKAIGTTPPA
jgi:hypothetical protein